MMNKIDFDTYVLQLKSLEGNEFQDEVAYLFGRNFGDFQPMTTLPSGDGGVDGLYAGRTIQLCCYGLKRIALNKPKAKIRKDVIKKFKSDILRVLELEEVSVKKYSRKKDVVHKDNLPLAGILADGVKIESIRLVCNWNEDNSLIGEFNKIFKEFSKKSSCNFIDRNCSITFIGPKEILSICSPTKENLTRVRFPNVYDVVHRMDKYLGEGAKELIADKSKLDEKYEKLEQKYGDHSQITRKIERMRKDAEQSWIEEIIFKTELSSKNNSVIAEIIKIKEEIVRSLELDFASEQPAPATKIKECKESFERSIKGTFEFWDNKTVSKVSDMLTASLIGECPLDWLKDE